MQISGFSEHALVRMQQRGIPPVVLDCLLEYGRSEYDHNGGRIVFFDKAARRKLGCRRVEPASVDIDKHINTYAVVACDGTVTTVGHRYKRIPRN